MFRPALNAPAGAVKPTTRAERKRDICIVEYKRSEMEKLEAGRRDGRGYRGKGLPALEIRRTGNDSADWERGVYVLADSFDSLYR
jgi:hypothetical protein